MVSAGDAEQLPDASGRRVLIIVQNLPVPFDRRVWKEALTLRNAGYQVAVICPRAKSGSVGYECLEGVHIYRHPLPLEASGKLGYVAEYGSSLFWELYYSIVVLRRHGFDVIHACNPPDLIYLVARIFKTLLGTKFVFDHHDLNPELYEAKFGRKGALWRILLYLERRTFALADVSIATNNSYREIAIKRGQMPSGRVFTVRSGPDVNQVSPREPDEKWKNGRAHLVAYVGVIGEQEGIDLLLETVDLIVRKHGRSDIQFVIMGSGPSLQKARDLSSSMGLADYVTFTGRVDDHTLFTVLTTADVCVNPDRPCALNDLSTMNKIMEYMAIGKPIVQFDMTEGRVSAQEASLYARNNDIDDFAGKVLTLIDDADLRERMGRFGSNRVRTELAWEKEAPKLLQAYQCVFALPQKKAAWNWFLPRTAKR